VTTPSIAYRNQGTVDNRSIPDSAADVEQFHVDNLSSAHVYLRMPPGEEWTSIKIELLEDCAQLTKANSIEGGNCYPRGAGVFARL
jgi:hypothetical protein